MYRPPEADEISAPSEAQAHTDVHYKNEPLLTRGCTAIFSTVSFGKAFADAHPSGSGQSKNMHASTQNSSKSQKLSLPSLLPSRRRRRFRRLREDRFRRRCCDGEGPLSVKGDTLNL